MPRKRPPITRQAEAAGPPAAGSPPHLRRPRGERRKLQTRAKLLDAAFRLMAARGMDAVAISEITETADVGAGSFYNHFESKEAIHAAVTQLVFEEFADALKQSVAPLRDPAEVIAVCVRQTVARAAREPDWAQFLLREANSERAASHGLGPRLWRDMQAGFSSARLKVPDPALSFVAASGTVLAAVATQARSATSQKGEAPAVRGPDVPERTATLVLVILGLSYKEAGVVARRPLPSALAEPTTPAPAVARATRLRGPATKR